MSDYLSSDAFLKYLEGISKPKDNQQIESAVKDNGNEDIPADASVSGNIATAEVASFTSANEPTARDLETSSGKEAQGKVDEAAKAVSHGASLHEKTTSTARADDTGVPEQGPSPGEVASGKGNEATEIVSRATSSHGGKEKAPEGKAADPWAIIDPFPKRQKPAKDYVSSAKASEGSTGDSSAPKRALFIKDEQTKTQSVAKGNATEAEAVTGAHVPGPGSGTNTKAIMGQEDVIADTSGFTSDFPITTLVKSPFASAGNEAPAAAPSGSNRNLVSDGFAFLQSVASAPTKSYRSTPKPDTAEAASSIGDEVMDDGGVALATHAAEGTATTKGPQGEADIAVTSSHDLSASALAPTSGKVAKNATFITGSSFASRPLPKRVYGRGELMRIGKAYKWAVTMAMVNTEGEKRVGVAMLTEGE